MLTKEYRICMPMSVEEYRIGQLYMIQKKSRTESSGTGSGVEILTNEPYSNGPGGAGQYTLKIYHVASHLPSWIRSILPKSVHIEEKAWNAYPYTKTIYRCPFIEKFVMEIETVYFNDSGTQENVFNLSKSDLSNRVVEVNYKQDYIDMVKDQVSSGEYQPEEDPTMFVSAKTGRGPLTENWREDYAREAVAGNWERSRDGIKGTRKEIMCAYKLCKVDFNYWGMQSKVERFIHDFALRRIMVRAHRQAWCWQDEYYGLTMEDIRRLERETQLKLREKMIAEGSDRCDAHVETPAGERKGSGVGVCSDHDQTSAPSGSNSSNRKSSFISCSTGADFKHIENLQNSSSEEEEEFFDADDAFVPIQRRSTHDLSATSPSSSGMKSTPQSEKGHNRQHSSSQSLPASPTMERKVPLSSLDLGGSEILFILLHGGSMVDSMDQGAFTRANDLSTLNSTFESIMRSRYPTMIGRIFTEMVACPNLCIRPMHWLSSLNPQGEQRPCKSKGNTGHSSNEGDSGFPLSWPGGNFPLCSMVLFGLGSQIYPSLLGQVKESVDRCYAKFCHASLKRNGVPFSGQVCILADTIGSLYAYDILTPTSSGPNLANQCSTNSNPEEAASRTISASSSTYQEHQDVFLDLYDDQASTATFNSFAESETVEVPGTLRHLSYPGTSSLVVTDQKRWTLKFDVDEVFLFGAPLGLVLAYRIHTGYYSNGRLPKPQCNQLYNLFYPSDPCALRIEPLLDLKFKFVEPIRLHRYNKFSAGENISVHLTETLHNNAEIFNDSSSSNENNANDDDLSLLDVPAGRGRHDSQASGIQSHLQAGLVESVSLNWWGLKRLDYSVYCPDALQNFPASSLPLLLHSSFWESNDLVAFILRQVLRQDLPANDEETMDFLQIPGCQQELLKEKWVKRRTALKVRNVAPNHRANDVVVMEGKPQSLVARFMYGSLDMVCLSGEKVDVYVTVRGQSEYLSTEVTDTSGRINYSIPEGKRLPAGLYPVQMIVRVDRSSAFFYMAVLPPKTEVVVFSIDGSFTASVSILGRDPKVRPGAVDVVRYWHDIGYLILYVTARPDMQHRRVAKWLGRHNFPLGLLWFTDGLSAEPLRQKASNLRLLVREAQITISGAYGSNKDVFVYQSVGLQPDQIFIVGKVSKKNRKEATVIANGYASHLSDLNKSSRNLRSVNQKLLFRTGSFSMVQHHQYYSQSRSPKPPHRKLLSVSETSNSFKGSPNTA